VLSESVLTKFYCTFPVIDICDANFRNLPCIVSEIQKLQMFTKLNHKTEVLNMESNSQDNAQMTTIFMNVYMQSKMS